MTDHWTVADIPDQRGRLAVVTGSNTGIGYDIALALAKAGAEVILACRNRGSAESAVASITALAPAARVSTLQLDLADLSSVAVFSTRFTNTYDRLDLLVNNAGLMAVDRSRTVDGFETQLGVNHLGHFALTAGLLPTMLQTPGARIASMSSMAHRSGQLVLDDLMFDLRGYDRWQAYFQSKLANLLFTHELHRRLSAAGAKAIAVTAHPGVAATRLGSQGHGLTNRLVRVGLLVTGRSARAGSLPMLRAATDLTVLGGQFYGPVWEAVGHPVLATPSLQGRDDASARALWRASVELTGLAPAFTL